MTQSRIVKVTGRRVWDSRGIPTVEAEVALAGGACGRAIAPAGTFKGRIESGELRDGGSRLGGLDVRRAVAHVQGEIAKALLGRDAMDQDGIDRILAALDGTPDKARLGANAIVAVSLANLHAAAAAHGLPLYAYLLDEDEVTLPLPQVQIFGGGARAHRPADVRDFMVMATGAASFDQALEWSGEVYRAAGSVMSEWGPAQGASDDGGLWPAFDSNEEALEALVSAIERAGLVPGEEMAIALDVAASELYEDGLYRLALDGVELDTDEMSDMLIGWLERYPIRSLEDPLAEDDLGGLARLTAAVGARVQIAGDDLLATDAARVRAAAAAGACNAVLLKPSQAGTVSETRAALEAARGAGWEAIVSARSGESEDTSIVHLAVGWGVGQLKVGAFRHSERMAKWNEGLRIEEAAGVAARFAGGPEGRLFR